MVTREEENTGDQHRACLSDGDQDCQGCEADPAHRGSRSQVISHVSLVSSIFNLESMTNL